MCQRWSRATQQSETRFGRDLRSQSTLPPSSFHCIAQLVRVSLEAKGGELVADQRREHAGNLEDSIT